MTDYTTAFRTGVEIVLLHEGGFNIDPDDPGGATNWGISLRWLRSIGDWDGDGLPDGDIDGDGDVDWQDIQAMSRDEAMLFYHRHWWNPGRYGEIHRPELGWKIFDLAVNMGQPRAHRILQTVLQRMGAYHGRIDGAIGPLSLAGINHSLLWQVLSNYREEAAAFYLRLIDQNSVREKYRNGWLNRAYF